MKYVGLVTGCLFSIFGSNIVLASSPIDGWYSNAFGGYAYLPSPVKTWPKPVNYNYNLQSGFDAGGGLGFKSNLMRYEGEITYLQANINQLNINGNKIINPNGYNNATLGLANVYYDFPGLISSMQPFLGAGIGYAWVQANINSNINSNLNKFSATNSVFAYQATGGLTYNFAENYALSLGYRYVATTNTSEFGQIFQAHLANLGAIYRFDGKSYQ